MRLAKYGTLLFAVRLAEDPEEARPDYSRPSGRRVEKMPSQVAANTLSAGRQTEPKKTGAELSWNETLRRLGGTYLPRFQLSFIGDVPGRVSVKRCHRTCEGRSVCA